MLFASGQTGFDDPGCAVSVSQDTILVGAAGRFLADPIKRAAYVFRFDAGTLRWFEERKLAAIDGEADDRFGGSVSLARDVIVVGARADDVVTPEDPGNDSGSVYLYRGTQDDWIPAGEYLPTDGMAGDLFGGSVAVDAESLLVGAWGSDEACPGDNDCRSGSAYFFQAAQLWLVAAPAQASPGDVIDFLASHGNESDPVVVAATAVDGVSVFYPVLSWFFDAPCRLAFDAIIPPGRTGFSIGLQAFVLSPGGEPVGSSSTLVTFL